MTDNEMLRIYEFHKIDDTWCLSINGRLSRTKASRDELLASELQYIIDLVLEADEIEVSGCEMRWLGSEPFRFPSKEDAEAAAKTAREKWLACCAIWTNNLMAAYNKVRETDGEKKGY